MRHPNSERFHELLQIAGETHDRKQADYGRGDDPFANVRASEEWGMPGWVGAMIRLNDKVRRLQTLAAKGSLANEAAVDSFMDIAVYALIAYVLYEQQAAAAHAADVIVEELHVLADTPEGGEHAKAKSRPDARRRTRY